MGWGWTATTCRSTCTWIYTERVQDASEIGIESSTRSQGHCGQGKPREGRHRDEVGVEQGLKVAAVGRLRGHTQFRGEEGESGRLGGKGGLASVDGEGNGDSWAGLVPAIPAVRFQARGSGGGSVPTSRSGMAL